MYYAPYFGQAYGADDYGECTYSPNAEQYATQCTTSGGGTAGGGTGGTGSSGGGLTDTGIAALGLVTVACLLIFVALVVRIWRRPKRLAMQEVSADPLPRQEDQDLQR